MEQSHSKWADKKTDEIVNALQGHIPAGLSKIQYLRELVLSALLEAENKESTLENNFV